MAISAIDFNINFYGNSNLFIEFTLGTSVDIGDIKTVLFC